MALMFEEEDEEEEPTKNENLVHDQQMCPPQTKEKETHRPQCRDTHTHTHTCTPHKSHTLDIHISLPYS